jgi:hypothetical protein
MLTNGIKSNWLLEELEWELVRPGNLKQWDGLFAWFLRQM